MTIKETKANLLGRIQGYVDSIQRILEEDKNSGHDDAYLRGCLATYQNVMAMIEDISSEDARGYNSTGTLVITTEYFQRKEN